MEDFFEHGLKVFGALVRVIIDELLETVPFKGVVDEYDKLWFNRPVAPDVDPHRLQQSRLDDFQFRVRPLELTKDLWKFEGQGLFVVLLLEIPHDVFY